MEDELERIKEEEREPWHKGPIKIILTIFLIFIIILWIIPDYIIKIDPSPKYIPKIEDVVRGDFEIENKTRNNYLEFLEPNDPVTKQTADRIISLSGCKDNNVCYAKAIFYFMRDNFDYVSDPFQFEYIKSARESLLSHNGDCDDASVLAANLLQAIGIRTRFTFVTNHVYIEAYLPDALKRYKSEGDWVALDLTCRYCEFGGLSWKVANMKKNYLE